MVPPVRTARRMKWEHGEAYPTGTEAVAAPATVSGESASRYGHWETGKASARSIEDIVSWVRRSIAGQTPVYVYKKDGMASATRRTIRRNSPGWPSEPYSKAVCGPNGSSSIRSTLATMPRPNRRSAIRTARW